MSTATPKSGEIAAVADTATAGGASSVAGEASLTGASENTREGLAVGEAGGPAKDPAVVGVSASQTVATPSKQEEVAAAANSALLSGGPQGVAMAAEAAAGSALQAPSVGSGPVAELDEAAIRRYFETPRPAFLASIAERYGFVAAGPAVAVENAAGVAPALMSREGAFGPAPEVGRTAFLYDTDVEGMAAVRTPGVKLAEPMPQDRTNVADLIKRGFDLIVTSSHEGFRRAGVAHPKAATLRRSMDFTVDELLALDDCPVLVVQALR
ncbi:HI1506-related protein [Methylobacterium sp. Leaf85]|uniref:HI1506-related protein n=1 Tax=Methylobacterium sp. Leaf85 TaxID=1736241 RepID=UPI0012E945B8|nr:HI1506-related protein [Methylobacterium sp. Leaf85]